MSLSANGEYLTTTHVGQLGVYLWCNRTQFVPHLMLKPLPIDFQPSMTVDIGNIVTLLNDRQVESLDQNEQLEEDIENEGVASYVSPAQISPRLLTISNLPRSHWANLLMLEMIRKRNRPREPPKKPVSAPFFLPTIAGLETQFNLSAAQSDTIDKSEEKSRLLKLNQLEPIGEFGRHLQLKDHLQVRLS